MRRASVYLMVFLIAGTVSAGNWTGQADKM